jgi:hypothetical protein
MFRNVEYTGAYKEKFSTFPALISCMVSSFILNELLVFTGKINIRYPILTGDPVIGIIDCYQRWRVS